MARTLKLAVFVVMRLTGLLRLGRYLNRHALVILCYHGISIKDEHRFLPGVFISPDTFSRRMRFVANHYRVVGLEEAVSSAALGKKSDYRAVVTFDDGFYNFASRAAPVLKRHGFPATVYLTTYYVENQLPIPNLMADYLIGHQNLGNQRGTFHESGSREPDAEIDSLSAFLSSIQGKGAKEKDGLLQDLSKGRDISYTEIAEARLFHLMNPAEVKSLAGEGFDFQLHTHRHRNVVDNREALPAELAENRKKIIEMTGKNPRHFAYPSGRWDKEAQSQLHHCGVVSAVTMSEGLNQPKANLLCLKRVYDCENYHQLEFEWAVSGLKWITLAVLERLRQSLGLKS